jgi:hypothetical protein
VQARTQSDRAEYRLVITRRKASEVLLSVHDPDWSLPRLCVPAASRPARQLVAGVSENFGLATYCLWTEIAPATPEFPSPARYAVLELLPHGDQTPILSTWVSTAAAASEAKLSASDRAVIRTSLEKVNRCVAEPQSGPFARVGWIEDLWPWVRDQIEPLGWRTTGRFQQFNASPTFSLLRIGTTDGAVWFKATGEPNTYELPISVVLNRIFPNYVPRILGVHPTWNAWLSEEAPGSPPDRVGHGKGWVQAARALAELQVASISKTDTLLEHGCRDLRLHLLADRVDPFLTRMAELMALQRHEPPKILTDSEIRVLADRLKTALCELERWTLPSTVGHLDLNPENILVAGARCCFLDWAEGSVTHPFLTFEYLREHARRTCGDRAPMEALVHAYLEPWRSSFSPETLARALALAPLLAVVVYAVAGEKWRSPRTLENHPLAGYFRALTRRAHREATRSAVRSEPCLT